MRTIELTYPIISAPAFVDPAVLRLRRKVLFDRKFHSTVVMFVGTSVLFTLVGLVCSIFTF